MIKVILTDGKNTVDIGDEGEVPVTIHPHPPRNESIFPSTFRQFFTDDGLSTGDDDMRVDGSVNSVEFWIPSDTNAVGNGGFDRFIKKVIIQISATGANLDDFGASTALSNGVDFEHVTAKLGTSIIASGMKTNLDMIKMAGIYPAFGSGTAAFRADTSGAGADTYFAVLDFESIFGLQWGLRLRAGLKEKLIIRINDNLSTGIDVFNAIGTGFILNGA